MKDIIWTLSGARLISYRRNNDKKYHWLFLPGGPGLGSESLRELLEMLNLPGSMWYVDFPGDGANISKNNDTHFSNWQKALVEAINHFDDVILVAHSSGGMFALATPEIENSLLGLVLIDSAPDAGWQTFFMEYVQKNPLPEATKLQKLYQESPSNDLLKKITIASVSYFSTSENVNKIVSMLESLPFNYKSHLWAEKYFDHSYKAKWIPQKIPTLIFAGEQDHITPLKMFTDIKSFQRNNIKICEIKEASHFPWIDKPEQVKQLFAEYCHWLESI